jgi:hypothetical protein
VSRDLVIEVLGNALTLIAIFVGAYLALTFLP